MPDLAKLEAEYKALRANVLDGACSRLEEYIWSVLEGMERVDRVSARAKSVDRFMKKAGKRDEATGQLKYTDPIREIQHMIGARIVVLYKTDAEEVCAEVDRHFSKFEHVVKEPARADSFGYFGVHYILLVPSEVYRGKEYEPAFFELQVKTLFQHAWSEAEHDLGYKPGGRQPSPEEKREIAFASAAAWGADRIFDGIFRKLTSRDSS